MATPARADELVIRRPGAHVPYVLELEPQGILGYPSMYGPSSLPGFGARASLVLVKNGFVRTINNSVAVSTGIAVAFPTNETPLVLVPIVMQWNFWLTPLWSVFGEPGLIVSSDGDRPVYPTVAVGGRFHLDERVALTLRIGAPSLSFGVSFLL